MRLTTDEIKESIALLEKATYEKAWYRGFFVGFITACLLIMVIILIVTI